MAVQRNLEGWREVKLGDVVTFQRGFDLPKVNRTNGEYPLMVSNGQDGTHNEYKVKAPCVVTGRSGTIGKVFLVKENCWPLNTTLWVKDFHGHDIYFVYYFLKTLSFEKYNAGSGVPTLNRNHIHPLPVKIPPLSEQKAIAEVLSSLDDKIDLLHRQNKTLENMAQALFRKWFVEDMDEGWEIGKLGDVFTVKGGTTPSTKESKYWNGNIHWTTPKDLSENSPVFLFNTKRKITTQGLDKIGSGLLPVGTVLLSSRAPIGYLAITSMPLAINQGYIAIVCNKILSNNFVYLWCKHNMETIKNSGNGSVFQEISKSTFLGLDILIPSRNILLDFDRITENIFYKIKESQSQINSLKRLRDTLLPRLIGGTIRVKQSNW